MLDALHLYDEEVTLAESAQFVMPMVSANPTPDPETSTEFTLNQFNMLIGLDPDWLDVSQIHFDPDNQAIADGCPPHSEPVRGGRSEVRSSAASRSDSDISHHGSPPPCAFGSLRRGPGMSAGVVISGDEQAAGRTRCCAGSC